MQTFITDYPENLWGANNLDTKRLVKQLLEARQIMSALAGETQGWIFHPAVKMWRKKEQLLYFYAVAVAREMDRRDYKWELNFLKLCESYEKILECRPVFNETFTPIELKNIIYTHRGRLYEKDPISYFKWFTYTDYKLYTCCERCNYYWPTHFSDKRIYND
jgi:Pyrimidine dimer DNA glycosylase